METAHSLPPESAGSRSTGWRCRGVDVASTGSAQSFFACGVLILPNCRHGMGCTAERCRECAGRRVGVAVDGSGVSRGAACSGGRGNSVPADGPVAAAKGEQGLRRMPRDQIQAMQPQQEKVVRCESNDLSGWFKSQCTPVTGPGE